MATAVQKGPNEYRPPYATATTFTQTAAAASNPTGTSISFARVASRSGAYGGSLTTTAKITDSTGGVDSSSLLDYFTKPYIEAHSLSLPTWRYTYILWFAIIGTLIVWSIVYNLSGSGTGGSALGALFRKWSIRRVTWTKRVGGTGPGAASGKAEQGDAKGTDTTRRKVVFASPTVAQMITVGVLILVAFLCSFVGDDYIAPTTCTFGGYCGYQSSFGNSGPPTRRSLFQRGINNPGGWAPFNDPLLAGPNVNIAANAWTAAARLGLISYAMLPLAVTLALKQWPFNIWATPFLTNYHFDKTAILHRWSGRVIWVFATGHAIAWFVQLAQDRDPFGRMVLIPVFGYWRFIAGVVCWGLLTVLTALSFRPIRNRHYELFYWSHVVLVILVLVTAILHHRPVMYWPIAALAWWGAERAWRFVALLWINGVFEGIWVKPPRRTARSSTGSFEVNNEKESEVEPALNMSTSSYPPAASPAALPYREPAFASTPTLGGVADAASTLPILPPPGFATAQLLPGRTVRLTIHTPHAVRWDAGQHLLLYVPSVRLFESHPYTIAGVDERAKQLRPIGGKVPQRGSEVVLLIRAQKGFSRALWDYVVKARGTAVGARKEEGVLLRTLVGWPMGSSGRVSWGAYDSLLIVCGGTGITFGISVLETACRRMVRKDQAGDKKWKTTRVRFVWIMREYAHISWVASTLKRCLEMCDSSQLEIELFVTHDVARHDRISRVPKPSFSSMQIPLASTDDLAPPTAPFAKQARPSPVSGRGSFSSDLSDWSDGEYSDSSVSGSPARRAGRHAGSIPSEYGGQIDSVTDLVLFEGEDDYLPAGEAKMSAKLRKEGKLRRALSRRGQGGTLRRPGPAPSPYGDKPRKASLPPTPQHDPSFEALPLDYREEHTSPYDPYGHHSQEPASSVALHDPAGDLSYPPRMSQTRSSSYDFTANVYDDVDTHTLGGTDSGSMYGLVKGAGRPGRLASEASLAELRAGGPRASVDVHGGGHFIDVTDAEQLDIDAVAELAKTGYPRLKQILEDEVEHSRGKTVVACCGPSSLNSVVRNLVAKKIDLKRVAKGDPRGQVSLVVEDFAY